MNKFVKSIKKILKHTSIKTFSFFVLCLFIFLLPRSIDLGNDNWNHDAQRWMQRSDRFIEAIKKADYANTYQMYHPGVTLMWLGGFSKELYFNYFSHAAGYSPKIRAGSYYPEQFPKIAFVSKFSLVLFTSILLTIGVLLLNKIGLPKKFLILFCIFLALEPFYLGVNRYFHLTGMESALTFLSVIITYYYIDKTKNEQFEKKSQSILIVANGIVLSLAVLTKISSLIVIPFLSLLFFIPQTWSKKDIRKWLFFSSRSSMVYIGLSLVVAIIVSFAIFPALWVNPQNTLQEIFNNGIDNQGFSEEPEGSIFNNKWLFYLEILFSKTLGLTLILTILGIATVRLEKNTKLKNFVYICIAYILYYFVIMSIPTKQMNRYTVVIYPFLLVISSYGFHYLIEILKKRKLIKVAIITFIFAYYAIVIYMLHPNYGSFYSEFIGGYNGYTKIRKPFNDGEHYMDVAKYLNRIGGKNAYDYALVVKGANRINSTRNNFLGKTFNEEFLSSDKSKRLFYALDYDYEISGQKRFLNCEKINGFGHRWPDNFDFVYLYECPANQK